MSLASVRAGRSRAGGGLPGRAPVHALALAIAMVLLGAPACMEKPEAAGDLPMPVSAGATTGGAARAAGRQVTTRGTGRVVMPPTRVDYACVLSTESPGPEVAWNQGALRMAKLTRALEAAGVRPGDMTLLDAALLKAPTAYVVRQRLNVTWRDLQHLAPVLAASLGGGADALEDARFGLDDPRAAGDRARERALLDAKDKAAQLAQELALQLGRVVSVVEEPGSTASDLGTLERPPSALETVCELTVTWELVD